MNALRDFYDKVSSSDIPAAVLVGVGILLLLVAVKVSKGFAKLNLVLWALAALGVGVWWHFQRH